ncbi:MAG TPA: response regulator transcription factor [Leptospiraceae bacterium]|nr:response regulator transcription factor [Leptospirales bacterium]HMU82701.1 response regulator transcription factor [Leptospiraceae bacterium]HMW59530.1 response regulator transcription factor [Leptospiraceae bacterium]HMX56779.1 response regulator transcription factor [Leptospiraceae bacterium]HMY44579.1 response regulator transcription factor [Leptospiraceae bacterium]
MKSTLVRSRATSSPVASIRVFHVEDHALFRLGLQKLLEEDSGIAVVGEAASAEEALERLQTTSCDIVLLDLTLPGMDGLTCLEEIKQRFPNVRIIALTMHRDREFFQAAIQRQVDGYVIKEEIFERLLSAIRTVHSGSKYYSEDIRKMMVEDYATIQQSQTSLDLLSKRELEVLKLIAQGLMNKDIAKRLILSVRTVESHRARMMQKLKISNVQGLVKFAMQKALI